MWKFSELPYRRPDMEAIRASLESAVAAFEAATSFEAAKAAHLRTIEIGEAFSTLLEIAEVRNTMDTRDAFYAAEMEFLHAETARLMPLQKRLTDALLASPFGADFDNAYGKELLRKEEIARKTQSEAIVEDLIEESELEEVYKTTAASCETVFRGETCNFYGLLKWMENPNRAVRKAAFEAWAGLYEGIADKLDEVYDKLIAVRLRIAKKLNLESYTEVAYANMGRADYGPSEVAAFRAQVRDEIVPAVARYRKAQAERIGVDKLRYYDEGYMFPEGNADPVGGEAELKAIAQDMYRSLSPETGEFFDFMMDHDLFDLTTRPGKHLGGYCTMIAGRKAPFIFSNFNGTAADVGVLTHEAGHAFAGYCASRTQTLPDYYHSTSEIAEIHSMTMEHFAYPWMGDFYGEANAKKAQYIHLCDALSAIPYLVSVDEFQHRVFENPEMSAKERRTLWRAIENTYMPWRDYDGNAFLEEGGFWMQKQHIFLYPFYYIDYSLAQVCAFQLYGRMKENRAAAWGDYLKLCRAGGSQSYFELLALANLQSPFAPGAVAQAIAPVIEELDKGF
ncbi:MAG: M3 family oligoendopeptidase [Oscillospiraceae bacterium]|jgi:M3 family oligoendopeptidase|nr:M3 family oligoendopeptidase [Oscillospiraceae bacterium]